MDNYKMKITDNISANLSAWMGKSKNLDTIKKVSIRSRVGFGTVQRVKNGDGNPTIKNLYDIAHIFGRKVEDLLADPDPNSNVIPLGVNEPEIQYLSSTMRELIDLAGTMDEQGKWQLIGMAKLLSHEHPRQKSHSN